MERMRDEYAPLLEGANAIEAQMAKNLLTEAGIPCFLHGQDFDVAELGQAAHDMIRGTTVFVPPSALESARAVLEGAWGKDKGNDEEAAG